MMGLAAALLALQLSSTGGDLTTIARDQMSGVDRPRQALARTEGDWLALWRDHAGDRPLPSVELSSRMVVAVFLGSRSSAGYAVEITGTRKDGAALVILWRETRPAADAITAQVITSPAHLVSIPRVDGTVRFEKVAP
jgi:hypothetical protein